MQAPASPRPSTAAATLEYGATDTNLGADQPAHAEADNTSESSSEDNAAMTAFIRPTVGATPDPTHRVKPTAERARTTRSRARIEPGLRVVTQDDDHEQMGRAHQPLQALAV